MVKITGASRTQFYSGDVIVHPYQTITVNPSELTDVEIEDIIQGFEIKRLVVDDIQDLIDEANKRSNKSCADTTKIENKINNLETTVNNLTLGHVSSDFNYTKVDW